MSRIAPLSRSQCPAEFDTLFALTEHVMGFVPNSMRIMARDPDLLAAFAQLSAVVVLRPGRVEAGLKALVMLLASRAAGCRYCSAHSANLAAGHGVSPEKARRILDYDTSPAFSGPERAALRLADRAVCEPDLLTDQDFTAVRRFFDDDQVLEIVAVLAFMGFLNRWNDVLATPLEPAPREFAERHLAASGWTVGKHLDDRDVPEVHRRRPPIKVRILMWLLQRWAPRPAFQPSPRP